MDGSEDYVEDPVQEEGDEEECEEQGDDTIYEVELILDHDEDYKGQGELRYLIAWKGYSAGWNSWEPLDVLDGCDKTLNEYNKKHGLTKEYLNLRSVKASDVLEDCIEEVALQVAREVFRSMENWEGIVKEITDVRQMNDSNHGNFLVCDLTSEQEFLYTFKLDLIRKRCPQKLITYFVQRHLSAPFPTLINFPLAQTETQAEPSNQPTATQPTLSETNDQQQANNNIWTYRAGPSNLQQGDDSMMDDDSNIGGINGSSNLQLEQDLSIPFNPSTDPWDLINSLNSSLNVA